jgi:hypothetical protein
MLEVQDLIRTMSRSNPRWGAPRIHGEIMSPGQRALRRTADRLDASQGPGPGHRLQRSLARQRCPTITKKTMALGGAGDRDAGSERSAPSLRTPSGLTEFC